MPHTQAAWQLSDRDGRAHPILSNKGSMRSALGKRRGIYWAENMEQKSRVALPLSPEWIHNCQGIDFCHLILHFILGHLLSSPVSAFLSLLHWDEKTVIYSASTFLSLRNDYLILPTHYLSPHYSQQVQHRNLPESVPGTHSFSGECSFTCVVCFYRKFCGIFLA